VLFEAPDDACPDASGEDVALPDSPVLPELPEVAVPVL
jgi:hypothetical protein